MTPFQKAGRAVKRWIRSVVLPEQARFPIAPWYRHDSILAEPVVQLALYDLCRPGMTVLDVGANLGTMSVCLSRAVGLEGRVHAFEASPRIVDKCQHNLAANGCGNVMIHHRAVYKESGQTLRFYLGRHANACADTLIPQEGHGQKAVEVKTVSLDDFCAHFGAAPSLIKMDIEGAEYDALLGAVETLAKHRPHLILEQSLQDTRCLGWLRERGYRAIDLSTLHEVDAVPGLSNLLFLHESKIDATPYRLPLRRKPAGTLEAGDFATTADGDIHSTKSLVLPPGRYHVAIGLEGSAENNVQIGLEGMESGLVLFRYHESAAFLAANYGDWIVDVTREEPVRLFVRFQHRTSDSSVRITRASFERIDSSFPPRLFVP